ncbi:hypothetical protein SD457_22285 [Coprobacillaceae bacterium CR2/5/TPMF4]|nr:hypothetical protein SD457_22285 [Coprobacillaceae bacterium CR2/5/TPMF4]
MSEVTNHARFRFSLGLKNDKSDKNVIANYHRHLDIPISADSSLIYVSGSNEFGSPKVLDEDVEKIKLKIGDGTYKKFRFVVLWNIMMKLQMMILNLQCLEVFLN